MLCFYIHIHQEKSKAQYSREDRKKDRETGRKKKDEEEDMEQGQSRAEEDGRKIRGEDQTAQQV